MINPGFYLFLYLFASTSAQLHNRVERVDDVIEDGRDEERSLFPSSHTMHELGASRVLTTVRDVRLHRSAGAGRPEIAASAVRMIRLFSLLGELRACTHRRIDIQCEMYQSREL